AARKRIARRTELAVAEQPERQRKRMQAASFQPLDDLGDPWTVRHRLVRIRAARTFRRIDAVLASNREELLRLVVIRRERLVVDRPFGRDAVNMLDRAE